MQILEVTLGEVARPKEQGVTLVTLMPTGRRRSWRYIKLRAISLRSFTGALRRFRRGQRQASTPPFYLEALNFIHFGRWIIIAKHPIRRWRSQGLPHFPGQPPEVIKHGMMVFTSNFDFDWRPYVDTFTETAMDDLGVFWDTAPGWQNPTESGFDSFFKFVDVHVVDHDHYYAAFPGLATANMKSALFVDRMVRSFVHQTADLDGEDWKHAYDRLVAVLQRDLGTIKPPAQGSVRKAVFAKGGEGNLGLTFLAPVPQDTVVEVRAAISDLTNGSGSPFAQVPGTHFGRISVIDDTRAGRGQELASAYILMSVDADSGSGGQEEYLERLYDAWTRDGSSPPRLIDDIWGSCFGFGVGRTSGEFVEYMMKISYKATLPFADYPGVSLWDIHRAVETQHKFSKLVFRGDVPDMQAVSDVIQSDYPVDPP